MWLWLRKPARVLYVLISKVALADQFGDVIPGYGSQRHACEMHLIVELTYPHLPCSYAIMSFVVCMQAATGVYAATVYAEWGLVDVSRRVDVVGIVDDSMSRNVSAQSDTGFAAC
jgi:hypothetical protein